MRFVRQCLKIIIVVQFMSIFLLMASPIVSAQNGNLGTAIGAKVAGLFGQGLNGDGNWETEDAVNISSFTDEEAKFIAAALSMDGNKGKIYAYQQANADAVGNALWSKINGPMQHGFGLDLSNGVAMLKRLGQYYEFSVNTGFMQSYLGMSGLVGFIIEIPIKFTGAVILSILTVVAYIVQYIGVKVYGLLDIFNVYKLMLGTKTLETVDMDFNNPADTSAKLATFGSFLTETRNMAIIVTFVLFALGMTFVVVGVKLANSKGTRSSGVFKATRDFVSRIFILTALLALLSGAVTSFATFLGTQMDDFGIQDEISGLIVDYRGSLSKLYLHVGNSEVSAALDRIQKTNQKYLTALAKDDTEEIAKSEKSLNDMNKNAGKSEASKKAEAIALHNGQFWLSTAVSDLMSNYQPGQMLSAEAIRNINNLKQSSDYSVRKFITTVRDGLLALTGSNNKIGNAIDTALSWFIKSNITKEAQDRVLKFLDSDDFRLISNWGLSAVTTPDSIRKTYGDSSMIGAIYSFAPRGIYLEFYDKDARFGNARMYFSDYTMPGGGLALFLFIRVCVVLLAIIVIGFRVYSRLISFMFRFSISLFWDVWKAIAAANLGGILYVVSSFLIMCIVIMGIRVFFWITIFLIRFPQSFFDGLTIGSSNVFLQAANVTSSTSSLAMFTSSGAILFNVFLTCLISYMIIFHVLNPFLERFERVLLDALQELAKRLAMGKMSIAYAAPITHSNPVATITKSALAKFKSRGKNEDDEDDDDEKEDEEDSSVNEAQETAIATKTSTTKQMSDDLVQAGGALAEVGENLPADVDSKMT